MRRITTACCASFWPKKATSGSTVLKSFATTVVTPSEVLGPARAGSPRGPRSDRSTGPGREAVGIDVARGRARRRGRRPPPRRARGRGPRRAGSASRSSPGRNCAGLTKRLMTTTSHSSRAAREQREVALVQVAHRRHEPDRAARRGGGCASARAAALAARDPHAGGSWICRAQRQARGCGRRAPGRRRAARASISRQGVEVALDGRLVAAGDRPGQGLARRARTSWPPCAGRAGRAARARVLDAGPLEQLGRRLLERDQEVRGDDAAAW